MNCAYYLEDIRVMPKGVIDWEAGEVIFPRPKTDIERVAVLWDRTREALEGLPHNGSPWIFPSQAGTRYSIGGIRAAYRRVRDRAGVAASFEQIRDGALTWASRAGVMHDRVEMLAGHRVGIKDFYVKRSGAMVAEACQAVERAYFG
jgi:integrase